MLRKKYAKKLRKIISNIGNRLKHNAFIGEFTADGVSVRGKNFSFLHDPTFAAAWEKARVANMAGWNGCVPDIRWRAHVACWAAAHGLGLEGDFVECGVHTGLLSLTILHYLQRQDRTFWLFDTFAGIPFDTVADEERANVENLNTNLYFDCYEIAKQNFGTFPNATLVKGVIPDSLGSVNVDRVCYLSIDLNNSTAETAALEYFWDKLSPSAIVLLDDYGFSGHEVQKRAADEFAFTRGVPVVTLPTGQGIIIKTPYTQCN